MKDKLTITILCFQFCIGQAALAGLSKTTITTGSGDEVVVKHGLFSRKTTVKDRFGNGVQSSKGLLGTKDTQVNVLGNQVHSHKGLFGTSKTEGQTILGDSFQSKKGLFGRETNIDLSGVNSLLNKYLEPKSASPTLPSVAPSFRNPEPINNQSAPSEDSVIK